jgi:hypothetical protein
MNANRNAKGVITAIMHPNATAEIALQYCAIIITAVRTVDKGVVDVGENEFWEWLKIHTVPLIRNMWKGMEGLQKMTEEFETENEGIGILTQVRWLENPRTIQERRHNGEIAPSSVVFFVKGSMPAQSLIKKGIKAAGMWYRVKTYMNARPESRCELCCGWGYMENKCGSKPKCGCCSGHHRTSDHNCIQVGCTAKQGSLCGHSLMKCHNVKGNHIAFSSRCVKKTETAEAARQSRNIALAGRASTSAARDMATATGLYRVVNGHWSKGVADRGGDQEEIVNVD